MDINATLIGQFLTFAILVWFTMKFVWPPITSAMQAREKKIADGLHAAEQSKRELELAEHKALSIIREAKVQASHIIEQANLHSAQMVEDAKLHAKQEDNTSNFMKHVKKYHDFELKTLVTFNVFEVIIHNSIMTDA